MDDPLLPSIIILILLIFVNAFFAAAEIAVISLNEGKLSRQAEEGDKMAARLLKLVHAPDNFLSTIQIVITLGIGGEISLHSEDVRYVDVRPIQRVA